MEFLLQLGHGMMEHCRHLVRSWEGGTVILSPRDLTHSQLVKFSRDIRALPNGRVLVDPQFYLPRTDHRRLIGHDYWPGNYQTDNFFGGPGLANMMTTIFQLNIELGCSAVLLPGLLATSIEADWLRTLRETAEYAAATTPGMQLYATVALNAECVRDTAGIQDILTEFESLPVHGAYILFEHPNRDYIVEDPVWLSNVLELAAGIRLMRKIVIVGYANHELLCLGAASVNAIAAGTWMNVRSFQPDRFREPEEEQKRRSVWYYSPSSLSEYKPPFLDVAQQRGVLASMASAPSYRSTYASQLFSGVQPSSVGFGEQDAFRHYLQCMWHQARNIRRITFDETLVYLRETLDAAERRARALATSGVLSQSRDFSDAFDPVRSALISLEANRGPVLRRAWADL